MFRLLDKPLVSIVTPSYNQGQFIEETLLSVKNQDYPNIEHIVIDGGSTDNTLEILKKYEGTYNLRWISEPDKGQSDAGNKGFDIAKGEIIGWLNSDDVYFDTNTITRVVRCFNSRPDVDIVYGDLPLIDRNGLILKIDVAPGFSRSRLLRGAFIPHPASFLRRRVIEKHRFNEDLHYFMDLDLFLRLAKEGFKFYHLRSALAAIRHHPERKTLAKAREMDKEGKEILKRYGQTFGVVYKIGRIWDTKITAISRRLCELWFMLNLSSNHNFAFPAKLDSKWVRFKKMISINLDELIDKHVFNSWDNQL